MAPNQSTTHLSHISKEPQPSTFIRNTDEVYRRKRYLQDHAIIAISPLNHYTTIVEDDMGAGWPWQQTKQNLIIDRHRKP